MYEVSGKSIYFWNFGKLKTKRTRPGPKDYT